MTLILRAIAVCACVITLCGCETTKGTEPPPARCMQPPKPLADVQAGDDIIQKHAELRRDYGKEASKLRCLQGYTKASLGK